MKEKRDLENQMMIQKMMFFKKWINNGNFDFNNKKPIENFVENLTSNFNNQFFLSSIQNFDNKIAKIKINLSKNIKINKEELFLETEILGSDYNFDMSKIL